MAERLGSVTAWLVVEVLAGIDEIFWREKMAMCVITNVYVSVVVNLMVRRVARNSDGLRRGGHRWILGAWLERNTRSEYSGLH